MPGDVEEKGEDRFEGDDERAEAWVSIVVDIVAELEDVLDVADGYGADADEEETKGGASFRTQARRQGELELGLDLPPSLS